MHYDRLFKTASSSRKVKVVEQKFRNRQFGLGLSECFLTFIHPPPISLTEHHHCIPPIPNDFKALQSVFKIPTTQSRYDISLIRLLFRKNPLCQSVDKNKKRATDKKSHFSIFTCGYAVFCTRLNDRLQYRIEFGQSDIVVVSQVHQIVVLCFQNRIVYLLLLLLQQYLCVNRCVFLCQNARRRLVKLVGKYNNRKEKRTE